MLTTPHAYYPTCLLPYSCSHMLPQLVFGGDAQFAAAEMADETNAAQASAEMYKIENNQGAREGRAAWA